MSRRQKEPLRAVTREEEEWLRRIARSTREPANHVIRATQLLAVAAGQSYTQAAWVTGRRSGDAVAQLVSLFIGKGFTRWSDGPAVAQSPGMAWENGSRLWQKPAGVPSPRRTARRRGPCSCSNGRYARAIRSTWVTLVPTRSGRYCMRRGSSGAAPAVGATLGTPVANARVAW